MNERGRPEKLTDDLKRCITRLQHGRKKKLKAPAIRQELRVLIDDKVRKGKKDRGLDWSDKLISEEVERRLPGDSTIQKYLKDMEIREGDVAVTALDNHWHLAATPDLPAEALPAVLKVRESGTSLGKFTVRQALWVARLYCVVPDVRDLAFISWVYALSEKICQLSGTPFDSSDYDGLLTSLKEFVKAFLSGSLLPQPHNDETVLAHIKAVKALSSRDRAGRLLHHLREDIKEIIEESEEGSEERRELVRILAELEKATELNEIGPGIFLKSLVAQLDAMETLKENEKSNEGSVK